LGLELPGSPCNSEVAINTLAICVPISAPISTLGIYAPISTLGIYDPEIHTGRTY